MKTALEFVLGFALFVVGVALFGTAVAGLAKLIDSLFG